MIYMDGASFSGYREETVLASHLGQETKLHFRGRRNLDATLDFAFEYLFLGKATEVVVSGGSAGGLATILHADHIAKRMREQAPNIKRTLAMPIVGFFLDHQLYQKEEHRYAEDMKYIMSMQNVTGGGGGFNQACLDYYPEPSYCFIAAYAAPFVQTPLFITNSKFDAWQLSYEFQVPCYAGYTDFPWDRPKACDDDEQAAVHQYGTDFLMQMMGTFTKPENGAFITSCICHDCDWDTITVKNKTSREHGMAWYYGEITGESAILIDEEGPNKNGNPENEHCHSFP